MIPIGLLIPYIVTIFGLAAIAMLVAIKNYKSKTNINFILFDVFTLLYVASSFISEFVSTQAALFWNRSALFTAGFIPLFFYGFVLAFTNYQHKQKWIKWAFYSFLLILAPLAYHPLSIDSVVREGFGTTIGKTGPLMWLTLAYFLIVFSVSFRILHLHKSKASPVVKRQISAIISGIGVTVVISLATQIVLPAFGILNLGNLVGIPSTLLLVGTVGYAILWHQMFDIRLVILRSVGYIITVGIISVLYGALVIGTSNYFFKIDISTLQMVYLISGALLLVITFRPLLLLIEKLTSFLFYRNRYDANKLINNIGKILASEIDLTNLCRGVIQLLSIKLHAKRVDIVVLDEASIYYDAASIFTNDSNFMNNVKDIGSGTIIRDNLPENEQKSMLRKYGIAVISTLTTQNNIVGYLLFSEKRNGTPYIGEDRQVINIISDELGIAISNSRAYSKIQQFNLTLQGKIKEATSQLISANEKLRQSDIVKDDFISMASHQLGTPLATIDGYLSMATKGYYGPLSDKLKKSLESALARTIVMKRLVTDLLNISRMDAGKFHLELESVDLNIIIPEEVDQQVVHAKEKLVNIIYHPPAVNVPIITIDEIKIRQAIMNLLDNAIYYGAGGNVNVFLECDGTYVIFRVKDDGIGVPEDQKAKLFGKFFRAKNAQQERPNGTGIGLYMIKRVIDDHNGVIIFEVRSMKGQHSGSSCRYTRQK